MDYEIELIRNEQLQTSLWSGGTTTQLAIFPKDAMYSERSFIWRLSSAKVDAEKSVFTSLPGIDRIIMIIHGEMILEHEGHHRKLLKRFDQDSFSGSWNTKSYGKVTDFNLMMKEGCDGELEHINLSAGEVKIFGFHNEKGFSRYTQAIYCVDGEIGVQISNGGRYVLYKGDIFLVRNKANDTDLSFKICNLADKQADLIRATICC